MDRRDFIRVLGGGAIFAAAGCAPAGTADPRSAWTNPGAGETDIRRKALSWAILAPNPHNMQPWVVDLSTPDEIALYIDRTRLLPVTDPFNRQIVIGCGAFLELLTMALAEQGAGAETSLFPDGEAHPRLDGRPLFRLRLGGGAARAPLFASAPARRTYRGPFTDQVVDASMAANLLGAFRPTPGADCNVTVAPDRVERLRGLVYRGAEIEAHTPPAHRESVERTFIGARAVAEHPWGISLDAPAMTAMNALGVLTKEKMATPGTTAFKEALKFLKTAADTSRGFLWIATATDSRAEQMAAGRAYLLANLAAARFGLAMHPWSQGLQEYATQKPVYDALHRELAPGGGRIQMLARFGFPKAAVPPAPRRGLAAQLRAV
ncbi:MAG: Acg family FMN-binding oxidoreductase [Pseudomonadota bacterium]